MRDGFGESEEPSFTFIPLQHFPMLLSPPSDSPVNVKYNTITSRLCTFQACGVFILPQLWEGLCFSFFSRGNFSLKGVCDSWSSSCQWLPEPGFTLRFLSYPFPPANLRLLCWVPWPQGKYVHPRLSTVSKAFDILARILPQLLPKLLKGESWAKKQFTNLSDSHFKWIPL